MAVSLNFPRTNFPTGVNNIGPRDIPQGLTKAEITYDITQNLDPAVTTTVAFVISLTTGDKVIASQTFPGGVLIGDGGVQTTIQRQALNELEEPTNPTRTLRAVVTVTGGTAVLGPGTLSATSS